ncbi:MAG: tetratricopeptide repeat protein [Desulfobacteraceae bacterium]|jgi:Flp pilus assembly protein TadD
MDTIVQIIIFATGILCILVIFFGYLSSPAKLWSKSDSAARGALARGDTDAAETHWRESLKIARKSDLPPINRATALLRLGYLHLLVAEYSQAELSLHEAEKFGRSTKHGSELASVEREIDASLEALRYEQTRCRQHSSLSSERERIADAYVARLPGPPNMLNNMAIQLRHLAETKWAIALLKRAVSLEPNNPALLNNLGNVLRQDTQVAEAVRILRRSMELRPDHPSTLNNLGYALRMDRKPEEAIPVFVRSLELRPKNPTTMNNLALAYIESGNTKEARRLFSELKYSEVPQIKFYAQLVTGDSVDFENIWITIEPTMSIKMQRELLEDLTILNKCKVEGATNALDRLKSYIGLGAVKFMRTSEMLSFIQNWASSMHLNMRKIRQTRA